MDHVVMQWCQQIARVSRLAITSIYSTLSLYQIDRDQSRPRTGGTKKLSLTNMSFQIASSLP